MARLLRCFSWLLVAIPFFAQAAPISVKGKVSSMVPANGMWADQFAERPGSDGLVPFSLSFAGTFDPASPGYSEERNEIWHSASQSGLPFVIHMTVDGRSFDMSSIRTFYAGLHDPSSYYVEMYFAYGSFDYGMILTFDDPSEGLAGHPLSPQSLSTDGGFIASYFLGRSSPEAPGSLTELGTFDHATLDVMSAVPEPSQAGMLLAGMVTLLAGARLVRRRSRAA